jgi:hypothetical protein
VILGGLSTVHINLLSLMIIRYHPYCATIIHHDTKKSWKTMPGPRGRALPPPTACIKPRSENHGLMYTKTRNPKEECNLPSHIFTAMPKLQAHAPSLTSKCTRTRISPSFSSSKNTPGSKSTNAHIYGRRPYSTPNRAPPSHASALQQACPADPKSTRRGGRRH